jgi:hypothetical protein
MRDAIDKVGPWAMFGFTLVLLGLASELGFRMAPSHPGEGHKSQAATLLGDMLVLLGFLLAFSFSMATDRFVERRALVLDEADSIGTCYLRGGMLPAPYAAKERELLRGYVALRLSAKQASDLPDVLRRSVRYHDELWHLAEAAATANPDSHPVALFVESLNDVIDLHQKRLTVSLYQRLPGAILFALYLVAVMSMIVQGFNAGVTKTRTPVPTFGVIASVSVVFVLILALDAPYQSMFSVSYEALRSVQQTITNKP